MENKYDGLLYQMMQESHGYEGFFDSVFGFLRRKTDFFSVPQKAEEVIAKLGDKHIKIIKEEQQLKAKEADRKKEEVKKPEPAPKVEPKQEVKPQQQAPEKNKEESKVEEKSDKLTPNNGNGSQTDNYVWTQTLEEISVTIPLGENVKSKDLIVELGTDRVTVAKKDKSRTYVEGEWYDKIHVDDSLWTIEEGEDGSKSLTMTLLKWRNTMTWWDCLVKSEPKIDTQKINPEPSKLGDLDGEMKAQVSKMMFDMKQKQAGLPSSEELEKQDKLQAFMKAHPEMDFSKAKFS